MTTWSIPSSHVVGFALSQAATAVALRAGRTSMRRPVSGSLTRVTNRVGMIGRGGQERRLIEPDRRGCTEPGKVIDPGATVIPHRGRRRVPRHPEVPGRLAQRWDPAEAVRALLSEELTGRQASSVRSGRKATGFPTGKTFDGWVKTNAASPPPPRPPPPRPPSAQATTMPG